ncbi:hypothetical protein HaLaN_21610, partial [Haematococcus lacustris]
MGDWFVVTDSNENLSNPPLQHLRQRSVLFGLVCRLRRGVVTQPSTASSFSVEQQRRLRPRSAQVSLLRGRTQGSPPGSLNNAEEQGKG